MFFSLVFLHLRIQYFANFISPLDKEFFRYPTSNQNSKRHLIIWVSFLFVLLSTLMTHFAQNLLPFPTISQILYVDCYDFSHSFLSQCCEKMAFWNFQILGENRFNVNQFINSTLISLAFYAKEYQIWFEISSES